MRLAAIALLLVAAGACLAAPADPCHERLLAEHGCCPFHGRDECGVTAEEVEQACGDADEEHDAALLEEHDSEGEAPVEDTDGPEPASEPEPD